MYAFDWTEATVKPEATADESAVAVSSLPGWYTVLGHHPEQVEPIIHRELGFDVDPVAADRP